MFKVIKGNKSHYMLIIGQEYFDQDLQNYNQSMYIHNSRSHTRRAKYLKKL